MKALVFVTQNRNKIADAVRLLPNYQIEHINYDLPEIQSFDIHKIIGYKIKRAYDIVKKLCIVQATGLYLNCLNGFPDH